MESLLKLLREMHNAVIFKEHRIVKSFVHILVTVVDNPTSSTTISTNDSYYSLPFSLGDDNDSCQALIFIYCTLLWQIKGTKCALFSIK